MFNLIAEIGFESRRGQTVFPSETRPPEPSGGGLVPSVFPADGGTRWEEVKWVRDDRVAAVTRQNGTKRYGGDVRIKQIGQWLQSLNYLGKEIKA